MNPAITFVYIGETNIAHLTVEASNGGLRSGFILTGLEFCACGIFRWSCSHDISTKFADIKRNVPRIPYVIYDTAPNAEIV
jgi:hypothetical protein